MPTVVLIIGLLVLASSLFFLVRPAQLRPALEKALLSRWLYGAALLRFMLGAALIGAGNAVAFPSLVVALGWLMALGGLLLVVLPLPALRAIVNRFSQLPAVLARLWLTVAVLIGTFLVYAALA
mgnify:CR=1 FL=1|tara:strand:+ start:36631 stop:37002 length:372 start_codon:yes stop_codon:yes gene_type:complete